MVSRIAASIGAWEPKRQTTKKPLGKDESGIVSGGSKGDGMLLGLFTRQESGGI